MNWIFILCTSLFSPPTEPTTLEQYLDTLPEAHFSHYVLMYKSRSLQEASHPNPRAILFGDDAKFIVSFNGHPHQRGFNSLEIIDFDEESRKFHFHRLNFPYRSKEDWEPNPSVCMNCHGNPPRPLWDGYFVWPGSYGSDAGGSHIKNPFEVQALADFFSANSSHDRYRRLIPDVDWRFLEAGEDPSTYARKWMKGHAPQSFGHLLAALNWKSIYQELEEPDTYARWWPFRYALVGAGICSEDIRHFIPPKIYSVWATDWDTLLKETLPLQAASTKERYGRLISSNGGIPYELALQNLQEVTTDPKGDYTDCSMRIANLRFVFESLGIDMKNWSMELGKRHYVVHAPTNPFNLGQPFSASNEECYQSLMAWLWDRVAADIDQKPNAGDLQGVHLAPWLPGPRVCDALKTKSLETLKAKPL